MPFSCYRHVIIDSLDYIEFVVICNIRSGHNFFFIKVQTFTASIRLLWHVLTHIFMSLIFFFVTLLHQSAKGTINICNLSFLRRLFP